MSSARVLRVCRGIGLILIGGMSMPIYSSTMTWNEEVLLHDGRKIIAERREVREGRHEIGQRPPVREHSITFSPPDSDRVITWTDGFSQDVGHADFTLVALHVLNSSAYIVTTPYLCPSYNKWGRPNPPYVLFKNQDDEWGRIEMADLPAEFKQVNVVINTTRDSEIREAQVRSGFVSSKDIGTINSSLRQPEYQEILRTAFKDVGAGCPELVRTDKGWISPSGAKSPIPIVPRDTSSDKNSGK